MCFWPFVIAAQAAIQKSEIRGQKTDWYRIKSGMTYRIGVRNDGSGQGGGCRRVMWLQVAGACRSSLWYRIKSGINCGRNPSDFHKKCNLPGLRQI